MRHRDVLHAGARQRQKLGLTAKERFEAVMAEFERGTLWSGSGQKVTSRAQALAIAHAEAAKARKGKKE